MTFAPRSDLLSFLAARTTHVYRRSWNPRSFHGAIAVTVSLLVGACGGVPEVLPGKGGEEGSGGTPVSSLGGSSNGTGIPVGDAGGGAGGGGNTSTEESICGNGKLESLELCDDHNTNDNDGCSADCKVPDPDFDCSEVGKSCVRIVNCGNGVLEGDEVCDEGSGNKTNGCSAGCDAITPGWNCARPGRSCTTLPVCGNGTRERGEDCDDGQLPPVDGDGCSSKCIESPGYFCVPGRACVRQICGDGNRTPDEACDDKNTNAGDGCSPTCTVESGYRCSALGCRPVCGDGQLRGAEACDDGDVDSGDGCSSACTIEPFYSCPKDGTGVAIAGQCTSTIACNNGVVEPGEVCDPSAPNSTSCFAPPASNACKGFANDLIDPPVCGNGKLELGEACDVLAGTVGCTNCLVDIGYECPAFNLCVFVPDCGDGVLQVGETCDRGAISDPGCVSCQVKFGYYCPVGSSCIEKKCGNGVRTPDEACDDGGTSIGDGCSEVCTVETGFRCSSSGCKAICGDGLIRGIEACDDSDVASGDGCSSNCTVEPFYSCPKDGSGKPVAGNCSSTIACNNGILEPGEVCDPGISGSTGCYATGPNACKGFDVSLVDPPVCGNGKLELGEACDVSAGTVGCTACKVDTGYECPAYNLCVLVPNCGDGTLQVGETCDRGTTTDPGCVSCQVVAGYYCPVGSACVAKLCGNGVRTPNEACDDGGTAPNDGCSATCTVETGWRCSATGCKPICGDGQVRGTEACDDSNVTSGDGCSGSCSVEPFFSCPKDGAGKPVPGACASTIVCGNGVLEPGEVCDPGIAGSGNCYVTGTNACKGFDVALIDPPVCGNGKLELSEPCDVELGTVGCTNCTVDLGYECPTYDTCFLVPVCGDGVLQLGEECDVGLVSALACNLCKVQPGYFCVGAGPGSCIAPVCGNRKVEGLEACDDGDQVGGDGCSANCANIETGFVCPPGGDCQPVCGDGIVAFAGGETCEAVAPGCVRCQVQPGYDCGVSGTACTKTICGQNGKERGEWCDNGDTIAGDGCGPTCQKEPNVIVGPSPIVAVTCGDGLITNGEACDDGNILDNDGCHSDCTIEYGWTCLNQKDYPTSINFKITYRDFHGRGESSGHPHFRASGDPPQTGTDRGIAGTVCTSTNTGTCGRLDVDGKPELANVGSLQTIDTNDSGGADYTYHKSAFALWYRSINDNIYVAGQNYVHGINSDGTENSTNIVFYEDPGLIATPTTKITDTIKLDRIGTTSAYLFASNSFYPLNSRGFGNTTSQSNNYDFTSELRYFFVYQGGENLTFFGDDDVFVFVNGRLAMDLGGIHSTQWGRVVLGDDDSSCTEATPDRPITNPLPACTLSTTEADASDTTDPRFSLVKGNAYEIVVFQAERNPTGSNYQLTLDGFIAPRSFCSTTCGDGKRAGTEQCDDPAGNVNGVYNKCSTACTLTFCGDNIPAGLPYEACDNGRNTDVYNDGTGSNKCAPGCKVPDYCGDAKVQAAFEACDDGINTSTYGGCAAGCKLAAYCGDGSVNGPVGNESCDPGRANLVAYQADGNGCGLDCMAAPSCGDGERNGPEPCDPTAPGTVGCLSNCTFGDFCGDGLKGVDQNGIPEECDYGEFGYNGPPSSAPYDGCTKTCKLGPRCGDGIQQSAAGEECDQGANNKDATYGACTTSCVLGPRCGDGMLQSAAGEACDNGINEDTYRSSVDSCASGCKLPPSCGDGLVQPSFEQCDKGAVNNKDGVYGGCSSTCTYNAFCGDGTPNPPNETCDPGRSNLVAYLADGTGCGLNCQNAPSCGDGVRNGPEQCDPEDPVIKNCRGAGCPVCKSTCVFDAFCGDGLLQNATEECDNGVFNVDVSSEIPPYGSCTDECKRGPRCGDGIPQTASGEECDFGEVGDPKNENGVYGGCTTSCLWGPRCGDGVTEPGEQCDNGINDDTYRTSSDSCGRNCLLPPDCGDGVVQPSFEQCDKGGSNQNGLYGGCSSSCTYGPFCGDGTINESNETCDPGRSGLVAYQANGTGCGLNCNTAPFCGDGVRNGPEQCDPLDPVIKNCTGAGCPICNASCTFEGFCGDGLIQSATEQCDNGIFNVNPSALESSYGGCTTLCTRGPRCGDDVIQVAAGEECDDGANNENNVYGKCTTACLFGPRCGDGIVQSGEQCDNGFNEDTYGFSSASCAPGCILPPSCGDGSIQSAFELCDDGPRNNDTAYEGCTTSCVFGPYCGDGVPQGSEACDNGTSNTTYSAVPGGCSYECQPSPYCGDGQRNGTEQCDNGADKNTGAYGGCKSNCTRAPFCGDEIVDANEACDDGVTGSYNCTAKCELRDILQ